MRILVLILFLVGPWMSANGQSYVGYSNPILLPTYKAAASSEKLPIKKQPSSGVSNPTFIHSGEFERYFGISSPIILRSSSNRVAQTDLKSEHLASQETEEPALSSIPNYHALIISVQNYSSKSGISSLDQPIRDGSQLAAALSSNYLFKAENIHFLRNPSRAEVLDALDHLTNNITDKDNLLIFYAGHGVWDEKLKMGYWLPADAVSLSKSNWIANSTIRDYIAGIRAKHTLLISDACFSGSIFKSRGGVVNEYAISKIYKLTSRKAMTSGTLTTVPDESRFMEYLLKRLNENSEKYLTSKQLFASLETAVLNNTDTVPQYGTIHDTGDEGGDFIFIRK